MEAAARLTSKGQITIPAAVRRALRLRSGDQLLFEVEPAPGEPSFRVIVRKAPDFLSMAGRVPTPPEWKGASWSEIREEAWRRQALSRLADADDTSE